MAADLTISVEPSLAGADVRVMRLAGALTEAALPTLFTKLDLIPNAEHPDRWILDGGGISSGETDAVRPTASRIVELASRHRILVAGLPAWLRREVQLRAPRIQDRWLFDERASAESVLRERITPSSQPGTTAGSGRVYAGLLAPPREPVAHTDALFGLAYSLLSDQLNVAIPPGVTTEGIAAALHDETHAARLADLLTTLGFERVLRTAPLSAPEMILLDSKIAVARWPWEPPQADSPRHGIHRVTVFALALLTRLASDAFRTVRFDESLPGGRDIRERRWRLEDESEDANARMRSASEADDPLRSTAGYLAPLAEFLLEADPSGDETGGDDEPIDPAEVDRQRWEEVLAPLHVEETAGAEPDLGLLDLILLDHLTRGAIRMHRPLARISARLDRPWRHMILALQARSPLTTLTRFAPPPGATPDSAGLNGAGDIPIDWPPDEDLAAPDRIQTRLRPLFAEQNPSLLRLLEHDILHHWCREEEESRGSAHRRDAWLDRFQLVFRAFFDVAQQSGRVTALRIVPRFYDELFARHADEQLLSHVRARMADLPRIADRQMMIARELQLYDPLQWFLDLRDRLRGMNWAERTKEQEHLAETPLPGLGRVRERVRFLRDSLSVPFMRSRIGRGAAAQPAMDGAAE